MQKTDAPLIEPCRDRDAKSDSDQTDIIDSSIPLLQCQKWRRNKSLGGLALTDSATGVR